MNFQSHPHVGLYCPDRIRGMFNLNDPRWGRGDDKSTMMVECARIDQKRHRAAQGAASNGRDSGQQPPDLDELWRDLNRKSR